LHLIIHPHNQKLAADYKIQPVFDIAKPQSFKKLHNSEHVFLIYQRVRTIHHPFFLFISFEAKLKAAEKNECYKLMKRI
jgi:hypothetical protein